MADLFKGERLYTEAEVTRAIQTALDMAAEEAWLCGGVDAEGVLRAITIEDVLARMEEK